jgi:succinate dehydrogenase / fumarate reductase membrane anchor subunit
MSNSKLFRTPMKNALGKGASGHGTEHVIQQRALAVGLLVGFVYCVASLLLTTDLAYESLRHWFHNPLNAATMAVVIVAGAGHFRLGIQVVIEDYIHKGSTKLLLMLASTLFAALVAMFGLFVILKLYLGA